MDDADGHTSMQLQPHTVPSADNKREWSGTGLEVLWWDGYDHAGVYDKKEDRAKLIGVLVEYVRGQ